MSVTMKDKPETKDQLAKDMGISAAQIGEYRDNYVLKLMQRGCLTDLDIGYWRAKGQLSEEDIGVKLTEPEKKAISLGHQKLLPAEMIKRAERAEGRGRTTLEQHTIALILGRFLPVTASESFLEANETYKKELMAVRDDIVANYDVLVMEMKAEFAERAKATWDRLETKPEEAFASWKARYVKNLLGKIPSAKQIEASYYWTTKYHFIPLPSSIHEEALRQEQIRKDQELLTYETDDRKRQIEKMNEVVLSQMKAQKEEAMKQTKEFLDDTVFKVRTVILNTVQKAAETMRRNDGKLLGSTVKSLEHMVKQAEMLNFYNDTEVATHVSEVKKILAKSSTDMSKAPKIEKAMKAMEIAMGRSVRAVENEVSKNEEIARIIGKDVLRSARRVE